MRATRAAATAVLYAVTGRLGLLLALPPGLATPVWPPSGVALAAISLWGPSVWVGVAAGSWLLNLWVSAHVLGVPWPRAAAVAAGIAAGSTAQAVAGGRIVRKLLGAPRPFVDAGEVFSFACALAACCVIAPTFGSASMWAAGLLGARQAAANWTTWWVGDVVGMLLISPAAWAPMPTRWTRRRAVEAAAVAAGLALVGALLLLPSSPIARAHVPAGFLLLPLVAWSGLRFGQRAAACASAAVGAAAIAAARAGIGPFWTAASPHAVTLLQAFVGVMALLGLALAGAAEEHRLANDQLERRVAERTEELRRSNVDLEQFAYVASHDLKEPLRKIAGFAELLQRRYSGKLDQDADRTIGFVVEGAERLHQLIEDLLTYSRVGRGEADDLVRLADVFAVVAADLEGPIREAGAKIEAAPLPVVRMSHTEATQLLQNLLANALKFRAARAPVIRLSAEREGGFWRVSVADNGIGVQREHWERIFMIFQRLHPRDRYPGTGIGLAICKKIVERRGGRIWLESTPGEGSTFRFTLPAA